MPDENLWNNMAHISRRTFYHTIVVLFFLSLSGITGRIIPELGPQATEEKNFLAFIKGTSRMNEEIPPQITLELRNLTVAEELVVSFVCKASGNPQPTFFWESDGVKLITRRQRFKVFDMPFGSVLRIDTVRNKDNGANFTCVAENGVGDPARSMGYLKVYKIDRDGNEFPPGYPKITINPGLKSVEKDKQAMMQCQADANGHKFEITWFKNNVPIELGDNKRLTITDTGSLQIAKALESDYGRYECVASNEYGVAYSFAAMLYVKVRRNPPHFSTPPKRVEVDPNGSVNLTCVAVGSPMPLVMWRDGATELNQPIIGKNVLQLKNVTESKNYTCVATSDLGNIEQDWEVIVKGALTLEPSFDVAVINITAVVGETATLPCSVEFLGEHTVVWTDEFSTLLTLGVRRITANERITIERPEIRDWNLMIHGVKVKDRGRYSCQLNTQPIKTKFVYLIVQDPPSQPAIQEVLVTPSTADYNVSSVSKAPPKEKGALTLEPSFDVTVINITAVVGETATLPCWVEFLGEHTVVWTDEFSTLLTFANRSITDNDRITIERPEIRDWNLIIHDVKVKDRGRYSCQLNTQPIKTKLVYLNVLETDMDSAPSTQVMPSQFSQSTPLPLTPAPSPSPATPAPRKEASLQSMQKDLLQVEIKKMMLEVEVLQLKKEKQREEIDVLKLKKAKLRS